VKVAVEIAGWIAAVLILTAYGLLSAGKLTGKSVSYQLMNIVGAIGFVINTTYNGAIPSAVLNVIWVGIGIWALAKIRMNRGRE
jgi:predicted tellurium resistance membrane protein TerC